MMQRILSIASALLIFACSVHLGVATHYCGGRVAAVKFSLNGAPASCGMEDITSPCDGDVQTLKNNCCSNELQFFPLFNTFTGEAYAFIPAFSDLDVAIINELHGVFNAANSRVFVHYKSPPGHSSVLLSFIQVFRV